MIRKTLVLVAFFILVLLGEQIPQVERSGSTVTNEHPSQASVGEVSKDVALDTHYPVVRVIDGDTIVVHIDGVDEKIRLIGVNTPETVDPRRTVECFGKEASSFTKNLLTGKRVTLRSDNTQDDHDKYGRLLRYVTLEDGTLVNKELILQGYAYEYTYKVPYQYQNQFKAAERDAQQNARGLWAPGACVK